MVLTEEASGKCLMHSWYKLPLQPEHYTNLYSEDLRKFERPSSPHPLYHTPLYSCRIPLFLSLLQTGKDPTVVLSSQQPVCKRQRQRHSPLLCEVGPKYV